MEYRVTKWGNIDEIIIKNNRFYVSFINYGAAIYRIKIDGKNVLVSPDIVDDYKKYPTHFGQTIGRYAGRIKDAKFELNDTTYYLETNSGFNNLHGGSSGLSRQFWNYYVVPEEEMIKVVFKTKINHLEDLFPGNLDVMVTYTIFKDKWDISIDYDAISSLDTLCNLTNHSYFNLAGDVKENILNHDLYINSSFYSMLDDTKACMKIAAVNQAMDFRKTKKIGLDITNDFLDKTRGYDHAYLFDTPGLDKRNITLYCEKSNLKLNVYTTYPAFVLYTFNNQKEFLVAGKDFIAEKHDGVCFECQYIPNGINLDIKDKAILKKNIPYKEKIIFSFGLWK